MKIRSAWIHWGRWQWHLIDLKILRWLGRRLILLRCLDWELMKIDRRLWVIVIMLSLEAHLLELWIRHYVLFLLTLLLLLVILLRLLRLMHGTARAVVMGWLRIVFNMSILGCLFRTNDLLLLLLLMCYYTRTNRALSLNLRIALGHDWGLGSRYLLAYTTHLSICCPLLLLLDLKILITNSNCLMLILVLMHYLVVQICKILLGLYGMLNRRQNRK